MGLCWFCHEGLVCFVIRGLLVLSRVLLVFSWGFVGFVMGVCWFCHGGFVGFGMGVEGLLIL